MKKPELVLFEQVESVLYEMLPNELSDFGIEIPKKKMKDLLYNLVLDLVDNCEEMG